MSKCNQEKRKMIGIQYHTRFVFTYFIYLLFFFFRKALACLDETTAVSFSFFFHFL